MKNCHNDIWKENPNSSKLWIVTKQSEKSEVEFWPYYQYGDPKPIKEKDFFNKFPDAIKLSNDIQRV